MQGADLRDRVIKCLGMAAGHPAWWVVALLTTLVIDRPPQFIFASQFLTGKRDVFPSILELTDRRGSILTLFIVAAAVLFVVCKALDYLGQAALIELAEAERVAERKGMAESLRRGLKHLPGYAATVFPADLARYALLLLPGFMWMIWHRFDPDFEKWCAYTIYNLVWIFTGLPVAVGLGVFSELAGREVVLAAAHPPRAWQDAWALGWGNRRAVLAAWVPTFAADLAVAVLFLAMSFAGAYILFLIGNGDGADGVLREFFSTCLFVFIIVAAKTAQAVSQTFKSALWTLTFRELEGSMLN